MILSQGQQTLVAQLQQVKELPTKCYQVGFANSKTAEMVEYFAKHGMLTVDEQAQEIVINDAVFSKIATDNGILDEFDQLTEYGQTLSQQQIEEKFTLFPKLLKFVSF